MQKYHYYEDPAFLESNKEKAAVSFQKAIQEFSKIKTEEIDFYIASSWYNYGVT
ncbi:hypothetical protein [Chryseobacterium indoltheticum]|uniref:hypothetical protein n=1 Tax=Chryseobacterium indoltheticum TaxID=254 RepID=UPI003F49975B